MNSAGANFNFCDITLALVVQYTRMLILQTVNGHNILNLLKFLPAQRTLYYT